MHDLDRTQVETSWETGEYASGEYAPGEYAPGEYGPGEYGPGEYGPGEYGPGEYGPGEYASGEYGPGEYGPGEYGPGEYASGEYGPGEYASGEYGPGEFGPGEYGQFESGYPGEMELEYPLSESEELELASQLLEVTNEQELDQFFGGFFKKIGRGLKKVGRGVFKIAKPLAGVLKKVAGKALPIVGGMFGGPMGAMAASAAGKAFGLELEGLSEEDREFEIARQYVRFATVATVRAAMAPTGMPPDVAVRQAVDAAARKYAPGFVGIAAASAARPAQQGTGAEFEAPRAAPRVAPGVAPRVAPRVAYPAPPHLRPAHTGQWFRARNGRNIVLVGVWR